MKMNKIGSVIKFTLEKNIRNKWFIGLNIILFVIMIALFNFSYIKEFFKSEEIIKSKDEIVIMLKDETPVVYKNIAEKISSGELTGVKLEEIKEISYDENLDKNTIIIHTKNDDENVISVKIISKEGIDTKYYDPIMASLEKSRAEIFAENNNINIDELDKLNKQLNIERIMVSVDNENADTKEMLKLGFNYLLFFILMLVLSKIANEISQEKISKSIEYVLTCINEKEYLIAKIISINLVLIIQAIFTVIYFYIATSISSLFASSQMFASAQNTGTINMVLNSILDPTMLLYVIITFIFLILTVIILCLIQAALSAKTTNISEAGNATLILVILNLVVYTLTTFVISPLKEPNIIFYVLSCVPIISMYFIPAMILIGQANIIQIIIAILINIAAVPLVLKISSKTFKNGILGHNLVTKENKKLEKECINEKNNNTMLKEKYSKYGFVIGMSLIIYFFLNIMLMLVFNMFVPTISSTFRISIINTNLIVQMIVFAISLYIPYLFLKWYSKESKNKLNKKVDYKNVLKSVFMAIPLICIIQIGGSYILNLIGQNYDILDKVMFYDKNSILSNILIVIYIGVLPAIFEELFFRKGIIKYSLKINTTFAMFASAIVFSIIHLNVAQSLVAFFIGLLFAYITVYNKSIIPTIILHFLNNTFSILLDVFSENKLVCNIIYGLLILSVVIGIITIIIEIFKNRKNLKEKYLGILVSNEKEGKKILRNKYIYILKDYIFIIAIILLLVMYIVTQRVLT